MGYYTTPQVTKEMTNPCAKMGYIDPRAKRVQEWLVLTGHRVVIDSNFGPASLRALNIALNRDGASAQIPDGQPVMTDQEWNKLISYYKVALLQPGNPMPGKLSDFVRRVAVIHLAAHPVEIGGQNRGPWVRTYMRGMEGSGWPWCAGFVSFVLGQAAAWMGAERPIPYSWSSSEIVREAKANGLNVIKGEDAGDPTSNSTCIFVVRGGRTGYKHIGFAHHFKGDTFETIEGNSNDEGSYEGYEVCSRIRSLKGKDLIIL